ncbi:cation-translocating P-type ATPase [Methyloversatilis sp.]|uniref:cation-translocating P-type ATPase n=1 Tax=Methyloversatilis sp. TaxID=2569862 RepID=UPI002735F080|nr:cation-translocating P-type ATPase [Methyloversatilis sp.]MDP2867397.1 cation-translocating P-type ATPase [Methyloversatilis sp.]MDP3456849.1 cation-translocating P-type ATPase [Methyloversatilis sp.]MDP3580141.1 cation-translocating P-type ATPase [Methyloversatilis sp.]
MPPVAPADARRGARSGDPSLIDFTDLASALDTDLSNGLGAEEAARRLHTDGPNELRVIPPVPGWRRMLAQLQDPLVYLLGAAAAVALAAWWLEGRGQPGAAGWPLDAIVIAAVVVLNAVLGWLQEAKAAQAVAALAKMTTATSAVLRDGDVARVPSAELVKGDLLVLAEGDAVGADARLVQTAALMLLEAPLTGESEPVLKDAAPLSEVAALGDRLNMVFKGTAVAQGTGRAIVTATGMQTEMGGIATLLDSTPDAPTPLQVEIAHLGKVLGIAALAIAGVVVASILLTSDIESVADAVTVLLLGVSLAVAAVPEGLPAILSVVLAMGVRRMAHHNAIVKKLASVETLGSASVIASDKTGTLTRGEMTVQRVITASGRSDITGVGYAPKGRAEAAGAELSAGPLRQELQAVLRGGSLASNAHLQQDDAGTWVIQGDPTEAAFLVAERKLGDPAKSEAAPGTEERYARIGEIPFTSQRKMMSVLVVDHGDGDAHVLFTKGAPDVLLAHCTHARRGEATVALDDALHAQVLADVAAMTGDALRTLAVARRTLAPDAQIPDDASAAAALEQGLEYLGTVGIIDPPREEAAVAIAEARQAGIRVIMITGDHPRTAARIAADLGIVDAGAPVLTGIELDRLSDDKAFAAAALKTSVFARVAPRHKLRIVRALQGSGNVVAMTGDGVNDAPALKAADIGVAMGMAGTEVSKEAARMILADDNFATLVLAVREGRGVLDNIRKFLRYLLSSNLGEVLTVFVGVVGAGVIGLEATATGSGGAVVLPLLATQILWINLITDTGPALAMGVDPIADDVMARKPRARSQRIIDARMGLNVLETGIVMAVLTLLTLDLFLPGGLIEPVDAWLGVGPHSLELARTAAFTVLVLTQLFNCFNARSASTSAFHGAFSNRWLWAAVALSAALQVAVVHLPFLNLAFGTVPLSASQWSVCVAMASGVLWFGEGRKLLRRWLTRRAPATPGP